MITRRTRLQLIVFAVITVLGVSFVGARYARLDKLLWDTDYTVVAHFASSGGIYTGGEVTYRGVQIGEVSDMVLTDDGVDVHLAIRHDYDRIPADALAVIGNRSAVGEQYVDLQPQTRRAPYLRDASEIATADTKTPLPTEKLLFDAQQTVSSVDQQALRTTVTELGTAFDGTGPALQRILDTSSSFIETANDNFDTTTALIRDGNTVLRGQIASESAIRSFAHDLGLFSDTLVKSDPDLRRLIDNGAAGARELEAFLRANEVPLGELISRSVTVGRIVQQHLPGLKQILVIYPYVVEGGFTVASKDPVTGKYDSHFGMIITDTPVCHVGYEGTRKRPPQNREERPMNEKARCAEPITESNPRGVQNLNRAPVAAFDPATGSLAWGEEADAAIAGAPGSVAALPTEKDMWEWLYLDAPTAPTAP